MFLHELALALQLKYFDQGNREGFLGLWQQYLPQLLQSDCIGKVVTPCFQLQLS